MACVCNTAKLWNTLERLRPMKNENKETKNQNEMQRFFFNQMKKTEIVKFFKDVV